ncbi:MAG: type I-D CRISPR-associated protein Cas7/Csc2 [Dethiobacter sp.]|jgi:CRISPR type I-D-associated protein Csc2|nr:MAG: type I-D CRISPR-associated protein Cas7/Csc2 [Dethiobacter sp.]
MSLELLKDYLVETPQPIIGAKTVQIILFREVMDYTVLRTEETRELNTAVTPRSISQNDEIRRVAFLGTKQKAVESRKMERILRTAGEAAGRGELVCYLKDNLCLTCPRCALFGGTNVDSSSEKKANIKHRIVYGTAFSLLPFEDVEASITFNAINDQTQKTGQALGNRYAVRPATLFPSIVTLKSVTQGELVLTLKTLLAAKNYGAETRIGGDLRNTIVGFVAGWEEVITPLELTLELYDRHAELSGETVATILKQYQTYAGNPQQVKVFTPDEVDKVVEEAANTLLDKVFLERVYSDVAQYREQQKG